MLAASRAPPWTLRRYLSIFLLFHKGRAIIYLYRSLLTPLLRRERVRSSLSQVAASDPGVRMISRPYSEERKGSLPWWNFRLKYRQKESCCTRELSALTQGVSKLFFVLPEHNKNILMDKICSRTCRVPTGCRKRPSPRCQDSGLLLDCPERGCRRSPKDIQSP